MVCRKLCQNSVSGWGSLEESNFFGGAVHKWQERLMKLAGDFWGISYQVSRAMKTRLSGVQHARVQYRVLRGTVRWVQWVSGYAGCGTEGRVGAVRGWWGRGYGGYTCVVPFKPHPPFAPYHAIPTVPLVPRSQICRYRSRICPYSGRVQQIGERVGDTVRGLLLLSGILDFFGALFFFKVRGVAGAAKNENQK